MPYRGAVRIFFLVILLALVVASVAGIPLSWDGAFYFFNTVDARWPFIPHGRLIDVALEMPLVVASHLTDNLAPLRLIFSLGYALVPAIGLAAAWIVCRERRPSLLIWPALACCIAMLPGQAAFSSEAIMSPWLMWPVFLAALIGVRRRYLPMLAVLVLAAIVAHPITAAFLGFSAIAAAIASLRSPPPRREHLIGALILGVASLARILMPLSAYESDRLSTALLMSSYRTAVLGLPLVTLAMAGIAAAFLLISAGRRPASGKVAKTSYLAGVAIAAAGVCLILWASSANRWAWALAFRFWTVPITIPFMAAAALEVVFVTPSISDEPALESSRSLALVAIGGIFLVVLSIQGLVWTRLTTRLERTISESPSGCISRFALEWARRTPLDHWGIAPLAIDIQERKPKTLVLDPGGCREFGATGDLRVNRLAPPRPPRSGWFELDEIPSTMISWDRIKPPPRPP